MVGDCKAMTARRSLRMETKVCVLMKKEQNWLSILILMVTLHEPRRN